jgi:hypothetical protein
MRAVMLHQCAQILGLHFRWHHRADIRNMLKHRTIREKAAVAHKNNFGIRLPIAGKIHNRKGAAAIHNHIQHDNFDRNLTQKLNGLGLTACLMNLVALTHQMVTPNPRYFRALFYN